MKNELENPFSVTKATEFSDEEINDYWVNFNTEDEVSIEAILNPREYLPKYVIGSKGCGKTHILRYFSFPLQTIRYDGNIKELLWKEKYIGIYSVFHGINSSRFAGKGIDETQWLSIFEYYFELYICDILLATIKEIIKALDNCKALEESLVRRIMEILSSAEKKDDCLNLDFLTDYFNILRRKIDAQILNAAFTRKLEYDEVKVLFSPGDLIFGIPKALCELDDILKEVRFIYIFDEYEKLFEWQKIFVNTLVWDKKNPVTFWIGARRHGFTTRETKSGQEMKSGSEFQNVNLDEIIRENETLYKTFAEHLFTDRLLKYYKSKGLTLTFDDVRERFTTRFEKYDEQKIINEIKAKNTRKEYDHIKEFRRKLISAIKNGQALEAKKTDDADTIIQSIIENTDDNPLDQKYKIFYFYKLWNKAKPSDTIKKFLNEINTQYLRYLKQKESAFDEIKDKRKKDFIAQLAKENNIKNTVYAGIKTFIELSQGNARHFILILKKVVEMARIRGEKPLEEGGMISLDSQFLAVYDTAKWFYDDIEVIGEKGKEMYSSLKNLTDYFIQERFCDKPVETTISCFYVKADDLSTKALASLELMKMHSVLIEEDDGRYDRNSGRKERLFVINKILAPLWNLPTVVRGSLSLNTEMAEAIFNYDFNDKFQSLYKSRKNQLNAPDFLKNKLGNQPPLF
ncbi:hypothetical protein [Pedobacter sp. CFBP9032]|uniref:ORC-CDC6 family AAA ATPase n=1 Tax=Pedobacter sp. CFBP9032 TaxID=3096539 RepID=UPI002A6B0C15|nr:hypothetical protein [Pedobacter sp. CFBP9032]MDY0903893.1 hypothetical protein [Pedobacter sp. CFBP9032]